MSNALVPVRRDLAERALDAERLIERWKEGRSPQTLRAYLGDLAHFAGWFGGEQGPGAAIDTLLRSGQGQANETAREYRSAMVDIKLAPNTINRRLSALRSLVSLGKEFGYVAWDLSIKNVGSEKYRDTRGPGTANINLMLGVANSHANLSKAARDVAIIMLLFGAGLRRAELCELDMEHLDIRGTRLSIKGKGRREREWVTLSPPVLRDIKGWVAKRGRHPGALFTTFWPRSKGTSRLTGDGVHDLLKRIGDACDPPVDVRPHGLRHSGITVALDSTNGNVRAARKFSRHRSVETLLKYDDNRADLAGEVAIQVAAALEKDHAR